MSARSCEILLWSDPEFPEDVKLIMATLVVDEITAIDIWESYSYDVSAGWLDISPDGIVLAAKHYNEPETHMRDCPFKCCADRVIPFFGIREGV